MIRLRPFAHIAFSFLIVTGLSVGAFAQFETRNRANTNNLGVQVAIGDFNRDGKLDFAIASSSLLMFLGNGDGTFQVASSYLAGTGAISVATADLNHDGKLDLAVTDLNGLYVLMGNGDGTFQTPVAYTTACIPIFVAVGDFTSDQKMDLLVTYSSGACDYVSIFRGNGDGTFQPTPVNTSTSGNPAATGIGDFNGDGKLDLAVADATTDGVEILLSNGDGSFSMGQNYRADSFPTSIAVADFLGNGKLGFAVTTLFGGTSEFLGNGDGTFTLTSDSPTSGGTWVAAGDLNGDGKPDLAVADFGNPGIPGVYVIINNGDGTFQPPVAYPAGQSPEFVGLGDFNGDHQIDLLVGDSRFGDEITLLNTGTVSFSPIKPVGFTFQLVGTASPAQSVTLTNNGTKALSISSVQASSPFHQSNTCGKSVAPGADCTIEITFHPKSPGKVAGTISIFDSASTQPQVIELSGGGTAAILSPPNLSFPPQSVGTMSAPQIVTLKNAWASAMKVTDIGISGTEYKSFSETNDCPTSLDAGASCAISVIFKPTGKGSRTATLYVFDNAGGSLQFTSLAGTGD